MIFYNTFRGVDKRRTQTGCRLAETFMYCFLSLTRSSPWPLVKLVQKNCGSMFSNGSVKKPALQTGLSVDTNPHTVILNCISCNRRCTCSRNCYHANLKPCRARCWVFLYAALTLFRVFIMTSDGRNVENHTFLLFQ